MSTTDLDTISRNLKPIDAHPLSDDDFMDVVKSRLKELLGIEDDIQDRIARKKAERRIEDHFEKIRDGVDLRPISFLRKGAEAADAVCMINLPGGRASGFLTRGNLVWTNNHVWPTEDSANRSTLCFFYEDRAPSYIWTQRKPGGLFYTDAKLDFAVSEIAPSLSIQLITPIKMSYNKAAITRNEPANSISHPRGRLKECAIHNNPVTYVYDTVIRYYTDTEPGSSGSPIFNDKWELVAIHHAGFQCEDGVTNEGVRVTAVIDRLRECGRLDILQAVGVS